MIREVFKLSNFILGQLSIYRVSKDPFSSGNRSITSRVFCTFIRSKDL